MRTGDVGWSVSAGLVRATFQTRYQFASEADSAAEDTDGDGVGDTVFVQRGDLIPGIPERTLKVRADWDVVADLSIDAGVVYSSSVYARGDENNGDVNGKVPGYALVDVGAGYEIAAGFRLSLRAQNLFDAGYSNFAILGENAFVGPDKSFGPAAGLDPGVEQFRAVGTPRAAWLTLEYRFPSKERRR